MRTSVLMILRLFTIFMIANFSLIIMGVALDKLILHPDPGQTAFFSNDKGGSILIVVLSMLVTYIVYKKNTTINEKRTII